MTERIDQLEDALIGTGIQENFELLIRCGDIFSEMVKHELLQEVTELKTTEYHKGGRVVDIKQKKNTYRDVRVHIGTLGKWEHQFWEMKRKLDDLPRGGARGFFVRLLLCVLVPILLWLFPQVRGFLSLRTPYQVFELLAIFGIPVLCGWAVSTGDWKYPMGGFSVNWKEVVQTIGPFLLPPVLFLVILNYLNYLEHHLQGRLPAPELLAVFTIFYVLLFPLRFRLLRDAQFLLSGKLRETLELQRQALELQQRAFARLDPILQRVDAAIRRPNAEYRAIFQPRLNDPSTTMEELRDGFRYVETYYSSLHNAFKMNER